MADDTYVYHYKDEHVEVKMTGRNATKTIAAVGPTPERKDKLLEITPVNIEDGRWKRFVRKSELLIVEENSDAD